jgi:GTPase SAR1 family protein
VGEKPILVLANKSDLTDERKITGDMLSEVASKYNTEFYYTSARSGENVEQAFFDLGRLILK